MKDERYDMVRAEWDKDSDIDFSNPKPLTRDQLHNKYWRYLEVAKRELMPLDEALEKLKHEKTRFFLHPTLEVQKATGWQVPKGEKIIRSTVKEYVATDKEVVDLQRKVDNIELRISFIEDILKCVHTRNFIINTHLEWEKFRNGVK